MGAKKIEVPPHRAAGSGDNLERLDSRVFCLYADAILIVFDDRIVELQFVLGCQDIIGAETLVKELTQQPKLPIIIRLVN
jgi:hypothetical protein